MFRQRIRLSELHSATLRTATGLPRGVVGATDQAGEGVARVADAGDVPPDVSRVRSVYAGGIAVDAVLRLGSHGLGASAVAKDEAVGGEAETVETDAVATNVAIASVPNDRMTLSAPGFGSCRTRPFLVAPFGLHNRRAASLSTRSTLTLVLQRGQGSGSDAT